MPRKMFRNPEAAPAPTPAERPGSGTPKEEARKRLHRDHEDEPSIEIEPEYLKAIERVEKAEPSVIVEREAPAKKREALLAERADLEERMEKLGGVWGGEAYFELNDQLSEINRKLDAESGADQTKKRTQREAPVVASESDMVIGELTPEDQIADARKTLKFIEDTEKEIAARQKNLQKELGKHGLKTPERIIEELSKIEDELREEATGTKPDFWGRVRSVGRRLAGMEPSAETKELLKKYVDLEQQMNAQIHARAEAEAHMVQAEKQAGRTRRSYRMSQAQMRSLTRQPNEPLGDSGFSPSDISAMAKTFTEAPEMLRGKKELQVTLALKEIEEEIRSALGDMESMQELTETELSEEMFEEKKTNFAKRIRALEEQGKSEAFDEALEEAEEALMRYVMAVHQRRQAFFEEARTAGKGEARPASVISIRSGRAGGVYAPGTPDRRAVSMSRMETADSRKERAAAEKREAAEAPERVNKEVEMYRSVKWRKNLIDRINTDESVRRTLHGVYEAFKHRMLEKLANEEEVDFRTGSPDPALDYALDLYRKYARRADGKGYVYDLKIRHAAHEGLEEIEHVLGKNWDVAGWAAQAVRAISRGKIELPVEDSYEEFRAIEAEEEEEAEPIPLTRMKRARSEEELEQVEELEIPITIEEPITAAEALEQDTLKVDAVSEDADGEYAEVTEAELSPVELAEVEAAAAEEGLQTGGKDKPKRVPAWERGKPFESPEQEAEMLEQVKALMLLASRDRKGYARLKEVLGESKTAQSSSLAEAMIALYKTWVTARPGARKRAAQRNLEEAARLIGLSLGEDKQAARAQSRAEWVAYKKAQTPDKKPSLRAQLDQRIQKSEEPSGIPPALEKSPSNIVDLAKERKKRQGGKK